jgi:hypothetical protein
MRKTTEKTLHYLQTNGFTCCVVERWVPLAGDWKRGRRIDAFHFGDVLAIRPARPKRRKSITLVQTCAKSGHAAHKNKILAIPEFEVWKASGGDVLLISWAKKDPIPRIEIL